MEEYRLFIKVLISYHQKCLQNDLPINVDRPILGDVESLLEESHYGEENITKRITLLCYRIEAISKKAPNNLAVLLMYSIVNFIEEKHNYFIKTMDKILIASSISANDPEQESGQEYWLTAWSPGKIVSNPSLFMEKIQLSKAIWIEESKSLKEILYNMVFIPPFGVTKTWSLLRCQ